MTEFIEYSEIGPDTSIEELLEMLTTFSIFISTAAAKRLDALYPNVPTDAIIAMLQKETLSTPVLRILFPLLKRYEVHVSQNILIATLQAAKQHNDAELLRQLEWEIVSRGSQAPIEELLQMIFECDDHLRDYYQGFFAQIGQILGLLSEWVTPERMLAASSAKGQHVLIDVMDQRAAIDILGSLKDFLPGAPQLIMNVLKDSQQKQEVRGHILFTLWDIKEPIPLPYLLLGLDWCYQGMQEMMVEMMTRLGTNAPIQELLALLDHDNNWTRDSAASSLYNLAQYVPIESLVNIITAGSLRAREGAVRVMGACGEQASIPLLISVAHQENEEHTVRKISHFEGHTSESVHYRTHNVRGAAWLALARLGKLVPLEVFLEAAQNTLFSPRNFEMYALLTRGNEATLDELPALLNVLVADVELRGKLLSRVSLFATPPLKLLLSIIESKRLYTPTKEETDTSSHPGLIAMHTIIQQSLHRSPHSNVIFAFTALEMLSNYASLDTITNSLYDDRGSLLSNRLEALIDIGKYDSLEALIANFEKIEENRAHIAEILGTLGENAPLDLLLDLLDDEDSNVVMYTSLSLYKLAEIMPARILAKTYRDSRYEARLVFLKAVEYAGKEAPDKAIAFTKELLSNNQLCGRALLALNHLGRATEVPLEFLVQALQRDVPGWIVLDALAQFGAEVPLDLLLPFLGDRDEGVSSAAARTIAKTHPTAIQSFLLPQIEAILHGEPTGEIFAASIQRRIAYRIGWMEHVSTALMNMLVELLDYPYWQVKLEAVRALGKVRQPVPEAALLKIAQLRTHSESQTIREVAKEVLAKSGKD